MIAASETTNLACGELTFATGVTKEVVVNFAKELLAMNDGARYSNLYIRPRESRFILGFKYLYELDPQGYRRFYFKITDILKRRFGNQCEGWSIGSPVTEVTIT